MLIQEKDKADGAAGGRRAASLLSMAVCAEVAHATLEEEGAKVDLKATFRHAYHPTTLVTAHAQVKSGPSYRAESSSGETITLQNISRDTLLSLRMGTQPALLLWVPPVPSSRVYYYMTRGRGKYRTPIRIPRSHYITPALRYDLSKSCAFFAASSGGKRLDVAAADKRARVTTARTAYAGLKVGVWNHPLCGRLFITRRAWRHVTRRSRPMRRREASLRVTAYLDRFVSEMPTRYVVANISARQCGSRTVETRELVFWYERALRVDGVIKTLLLRVREEISYPSEWWRYPLGVGDVSQKATLTSWWCKDAR